MNRRVVVHSASGSTASMRDVDWHEVRAERDALLDRTDWRAVKDRTMSQAWKDYRKALRDLPQDYETANDAVDHWPEAPA